MPDPILWPGILAPRAVDPAPIRLDDFGPQSFSGADSVVGRDAGYWALALIDIPLVTAHSRGGADAILCYRGLASGAAQTFLVPVYDARRNPAWRAGRAIVGPLGVPHSDGASFSDGSDYETPNVAAFLVAGIALRAVTAEIDMPSGVALEAGQFFGLGSGAGTELHVIKRAFATATADRWAVTFWPPARAAHSAGAAVEIDCPRLRARVLSWPRAPLQHGFDGRVTLDFREAI